MSTTTAELTQDEKRARIAKAMGWTLVDLPDHPNGPKLLWKTPYGRQLQSGTVNALPDCFNDLNAMREARKMLSGDDQEFGSQRWRYAAFLSEIVGVDQPFHEPLPADEVFKIADATAEQHSEAFGKALNLW